VSLSLASTSNDTDEIVHSVMNANAKDPASDLSLAKVLQAHDLLDRKTEEYKARLLARQYRAQQYLATGEGHAPNLELLQAHTDSFADISARAQDLRIKLAAFDELPSVSSASCELRCSTDAWMSTEPGICESEVGGTKAGDCK
jgi:hypothetical protein